MRAKSREFYDEAKTLAAAKKYNGAASRLYYSLYHAITAGLEEKGIKQSDLTHKIDPDKPGYWLHEVVRNNSTLVGVRRNDVQCIKASWQLRVTADYGSNGVEDYQVMELLPRAKLILDYLGISE